ncbi:MAG: FISUMP domain-containing protein [Fibrobacter sp.]|nr:FISUMP domain-containing protein [Fibrobacter sp.]
MLSKAICTFTAALVFTIAACGDDNPTNFYAESSSSEAPLSSSAIEELSSSSSFNAISSSSEISSSSWPQYSYGELIDKRDGQVYKTIKIGEQIWMAENLNFAYSLPTSNKDSSNTTSNKQTSKDKYGKLYRWSIAMDSAAVFSLDGKGCGKGVNCGSQPSKGVRGVCPENWHIPNETDIKNIIDFSKESNDRLIWIEHYWFFTENEDNEFKTEMKLQYYSFWTSEQLDNNNAKGLYFKTNKTSTNSTPKAVAYPVRCVKDDQTIQVEHGTMTDERDGQVYKTVKIGDQWWMAENLNYAYTKPTPQYYYGTIDIIDSASFCYNNEPDSCAKYGRLYTWEASMDCVDAEIDDYRCPIKSRNNDFKIRGVCPDKWHVPSVNEWKSLQYVVNYFATDLKSTEGWLDNGNGSDVVGFRILPTGYYINYLENFEFNFAFEDIGKKTCFWTLRQETIYPDCPICAEDAYPFCISSNSKDFSFNKEPKIYAFPVRCVKDQ